MTRIITLFFIAGLLTACAGSGPVPFIGALFGYTPPPEETTIAEELKLEYDRCMKIGEEENCAQWAYDIVRKVKGLEPRAVPKGVVIILEGDGNVEKEEQPKPEENQN